MRAVAHRSRFDRVQGPELAEGRESTWRSARHLKSNAAVMVEGMSGIAPIFAPLSAVPGRSVALFRTTPRPIGLKTIASGSVAPGRDL
jgi:hypothetical protein